MILIWILGLIHAVLPAAPSVVQKPVNLAGVIVDAAADKVVVGASVMLTPVRSRRGRQSVTTDSHGRFVFPNVQSGEYHLDATALGFIRGAFGQVAPNTEAAAVVIRNIPHPEVVIRLWRTAAIGGRVSVEQNRPASDVRVVAIPVTMLRTGGPLISGSDVTDQDGIYEISGVPPGAYLVGVLSSFASFMSYDDTKRNQDSLQSLKQLTLMPVKDAWLAYSLLRGSTLHAWLDGETLMVRPAIFYPSVSLASAQPVLVVAGDSIQHVNLHWPSVPATDITGVVTAAGVPASDVTVLAMRDELDAFDVPAELRVVAMCSTDSRGRFRLLGLVPGPYRIMAVGRLSQLESSGVPSWATRVVDTTERATVSADVSLQAGGAVSGRVQDASDGAPVPEHVWRNAVVSISVSGSPRWNSGASSRVRPGGVFELGPVIPDRYLLEVSSLESGWVVDSITVGREIHGGLLDVNGVAPIDLVISLTNRLNRLEARLQASAEAAVASIVLLFPADPNRWSHGSVDRQRFRQCTVRSSRLCTFEAVPSGEYLLTAVTADALSPRWNARGEVERLSTTAVRVAVEIGRHQSVLVPRHRR